jgi:endoglucanase
MISTTSVSTTTVTNPTRVPYAGVNIAGFDFGCTDACDYNCPYTEDPPLPSQNGANGPGQMNHFVTDDGMNAFRLPVRWEYLVDGVLNGDLSESQFQIYDQLVQACITSGAELCIIDLHNYAHWNNYLIGSGANAPSASSFASIWGQLAGKYASDSQVAFGLMNEPHSGCNSDILDMGTWDSILQGAVHAIRSAGATSQMILLPGSEWTHTLGYLNNDSSDLQMVLDITDPTDATGAKLIVEVHEYLNPEDSGCSADSCGSTDSPICVTNSTGTDNGRGGLQNFVNAMREFGPGRKAMLTETGGNNDATYGCATYLCQELSFLK